ncbi:MAG: hypothetical protein A2452_02295 [Candidatus Firestonebacteria bacterium RIFOXYC2_FULL_39_67]|nr:MAG: hypothetical protein A2536_10500 [Candidatus Firestonebacteria bacterium RIFOXYD2_FULL_39_29]OGF53330.1 MAG: hypothetical protein A2452_02295 [Candidatus Firestonebacteria bacterium RIFOXYC2_FULL_39_67]
MTKIELFFRRALVLLILGGIIFFIIKVFLFLFPAEEMVIDVPLTPAKAVALTFDDGPHPEFTLKLLEILDKNDVKATFFVVGKQIKKYPEFLREIQKRGHEIGNHTFNHPLLTTLDRTGVINELELNKIEIKKETGMEVNIFRPPSGRYDEKVLEAALSKGFIPVLWSVSGSDYGSTDPKVVMNNVLSAVRNGDIILLHSGVEATLKALPEIIAEIKKRCFEFKTVTQMLKTDKVPKKIYIYKNNEPVAGDRR